MAPFTVTLPLMYLTYGSKINYKTAKKGVQVFKKLDYKALMLTPDGLVTALQIAISQLRSSSVLDADNSNDCLCAKMISNVYLHSLFCIRRHPRHCSGLQTL